MHSSICYSCLLQSGICIFWLREKEIPFHSVTASIADVNQPNHCLTLPGRREQERACKCHTRKGLSGNQSSSLLAVRWHLQCQDACSDFQRRPECNSKQCWAPTFSSTAGDAPYMCSYLLFLAGGSLTSGQTLSADDYSTVVDLDSTGWVIVKHPTLTHHFGPNLVPFDFNVMFSKKWCHV